jgi:hypothetical protein
MTDHYLNAELCAACLMKKQCSAVVAGGEWNPYITAQSRPCPAVLHNNGGRKNE